MTQIRLTTKNKQKIIIEVLDNPFTKEFIEQLKFVQKHWKMHAWRERIPYERKMWDDAIARQCEQNIISAIVKLNEMQTNFPVPVEDIYFDDSPRSRDLLNRLHRHFTTGHRTHSYGELTTWLFDSEYVFTLEPEYSAEFTRQVHIINDNVHTIEGHQTNERIKSFPPKSEFHIYFDSSQPIDPANNPQMKHFVKIKDEHFQYFSDELKYDVWLPIFQIQGKNYWVSYFDYDDPTHWDVSTNVMYTGSFCLADRSAAKVPELLDYLKSYGITPGPLHCGMPIGNITVGRPLFYSLRTGDIETLEIYE